MLLTQSKINRPGIFAKNRWSNLILILILVVESKGPYKPFVGVIHFHISADTVTRHHSFIRTKTCWLKENIAKLSKPYKEATPCTHQHELFINFQSSSPSSLCFKVFNITHFGRSRCQCQGRIHHTFQNGSKETHEII